MLDEELRRIQEEERLLESQIQEQGKRKMALEDERAGSKHRMAKEKAALEERIRQLDLAITDKKSSSNSGQRQAFAETKSKLRAENEVV